MSKCKHKNTSIHSWGRSYELKFFCKDCQKVFTQSEYSQSSAITNGGKE